MLCYRCCLLLLPGLSTAFLYQPGSPSNQSLGEIWDPSVTWWRGKYYAHAMYQKPGLRTNVYESGWLAVSDDGCHWADGGAVAPEHLGDMWWKGFVRQIRGSPANMTDDALFIMDHGVDEPGKGNDALRFLTSTDLRHWKENSTSHPDPRWYNTHGRWDHMYMSADASSGGYIGFAVSSPTVSGYAHTWPGINRSPDGITWTQCPPLNVSWNGVGSTSIEEGGFERLRAPDGTERYYLIGGGGGPEGGPRSAYSMWVFSSAQIDGPYTPLQQGFRLSGGGAGGGSGRFGWLAAWCGPHCDGSADGTPLISNYITPGPNARADVWMLPMRKPVVDAAGRLRLGYWEANDGLRGAGLALNSTSTSLSCSGMGHGVRWLKDLDTASHLAGAILNVTLRASGTGSIGIALEDIVDPARVNRSYMPHTDLPGGDVKYFGVNYSDPKKCEAACDASAECSAWTYVGGHHASSPYPVPRCCLKRGRLSPRPDPSCTSGFKAIAGKSSSSYTTLLVSLATGNATQPTAAELHHVVESGGEGASGKPVSHVIDRATQFRCGPAATCDVATVTRAAPEQDHSLLLFFRRGMFELYLDGLLVQTFVYGGVYPLPAGAHGRVGLACNGDLTVEASGAQMWQMNL